MILLWLAKIQRRPFKENPLIIYRPERLSKVRKGVEMGVTTLGWVIWFIIVRPIILIFLWVIGVRIFMEHMVKLGGLSGLSQLSEVYLTTIIILLLMLQSWNRYNYLKYGRNNRRRFVRAVTEPEVADFFKIVPEDFGNIKDWDQISVKFFEKNKIEISHSSLGDTKIIIGEFVPS